MIEFVVNACKWCSDMPIGGVRTVIDIARNNRCQDARRVRGNWWRIRSPSPRRVGGRRVSVRKMTWRVRVELSTRNQAQREKRSAKTGDFFHGWFVRR